MGEDRSYRARGISYQSEGRRVSRRTFLTVGGVAVGVGVLAYAAGYLTSMSRVPSTLTNVGVSVSAFPDTEMLFWKMTQEGILKKYAAPKGYGFDCRVLAEDVPSFVGRATDMGFPAGVELSGIRASGSDIVAFGACEGTAANWFVRADSPFADKTAEDLQGKTIAIPEWGSSYVESWQMYLLSEGIDLKKDYNVVVGGWGDSWTSLLNGKVDAIINDLTVDPEDVASGKLKIWPAVGTVWQNKTGHMPPALLWCAYSDWLAKNEDAAKVAILANEEAATEIYADPTTFMNTYLPQAFPPPSGISDAAKKLLWDQHLAGMYFKTVRIDQAWIQKELDWLNMGVSLGIIDKSVLNGMYESIIP